MIRTGEGEEDGCYGGGRCNETCGRLSGHCLCEFVSEIGARKVDKLVSCDGRRGGGAVNWEGGREIFFFYLFFFRIDGTALVGLKTWPLECSCKPWMKQIRVHSKITTVVRNKLTISTRLHRATPYATASASRVITLAVRYQEFAPLPLTRLSQSKAADWRTRTLLWHPRSHCSHLETLCTASRTFPVLLSSTTVPPFLPQSEIPT